MNLAPSSPRTSMWRGTGVAVGGGLLLGGLLVLTLALAALVLLPRWTPPDAEACGTLLRGSYAYHTSQNAGAAPPREARGRYLQEARTAQEQARDPELRETLSYALRGGEEFIRGRQDSPAEVSLANAEARCTTLGHSL